MEIVFSIVAKVGEYMVAPIGRQAGYLIYYKSNMKTLETQIGELGNRRSRVQHSVDAAKRNGELIEDDVDKWLAEANEVMEEVQKFLEDEIKENKRCLGGWSPDLTSRYSFSRKSKKKAQVITELLGKGSFERVSYAAPSSAMEYVATEGFADFESRKLVMEEIMAVLKDDGNNAIGICGLGGVGKTTTVNEVHNRAKVEKLFDEIVMAIVGQTPDLRKIQGEIADKLGLKLEEESLSGRADRICERLKGFKVLVILDDVWEVLDLKAVGIPFGGVHKDCKVMLTSRSQEVCNLMGTLRNFTISLLSDREAWNLFKEKAGNSIESPDLYLIAQEILKECGGLPIAIVTVGVALRNKDKVIWNNALRQLRISNPENITGMDKKVYRSLELSYDFLESEEAKSCLLLCCIYEEDFYIPVEDLVRYGMGLGLFKGIYALVEARDRVHTLVEILKGCYLLLDSDKEGCLKMHDVVRDVIRSIAARNGMDKQYTSITTGKMPVLDCIRSIPAPPVRGFGLLWEALYARGLPLPLEPVLPKTLPASLTDELLLDQFNCSKLELLLWTDSPPKLPDILFERMEELPKLPGILFEGMEELKVLQITGRIFNPSPPPSLSFLTKLQTLSLDHCMFEDISVIGELTTLTILSFRNSSIKALPREIGKLVHLKLLDLTECEDLKKVAPGVISSLIRLEELYMKNAIVQWEVEEGNSEKNNVNIAELQCLSHLVALEIHLPTAKFPGSNSFFKKLMRFKISVGIYKDWDRSHHKSIQLINGNQFQNELRVKFDPWLSVESGMNVLPKKTKILELEGVKNVPNDSIRETFIHLKNLAITSCDVLGEYLIDTVDLVPDSIFPILESLKISDVHNLKSICHGKLPAGSFGELRFLSVHNVSELMHLWKGPTQYLSLGNLRHIELSGCDGLENVFSQSIAISLVQLEDLQIGRCKMMEEIVATERVEHGKGTSMIKFPKLRHLTLEKLPSIIGFCKKIAEIEFPQLRHLRLDYLGKLKSFSSSSLTSEGDHDTAMQHLFNEKVKSLCELRSMQVHHCQELLNVFSSNSVQVIQKLKEFEVDSCGSLEVIFDFEGVKIEEGHAAVMLTCLKLNELPKLTHVWKKAPKGIQGFQNLQFLQLLHCDSLKSIFSPSMAKLLVKLKKLEVNSCKMMEEIVGKDQEGGEESEEGTKVIVFPLVNSLSLTNVPHLSSFCPGPYTVEWRSLKELYFSCSAPTFLGTQKPRTINVRSHEEMQEDYFNTSIRLHLFNERVEFPSMKVVRLYGLDFVEWIADGQLPSKSFCELGEMSVEECNKLLNVVPSNLLQRLKNLERLTIRHCASLLWVFEIEGMNVEERDMVLLPKLKQLELRNLPELKHMWDREPKGILLFQTLRELRVQNCSSLRNLFSPSTAKSMEKLQWLYIIGCEMMTEIIAEDEGEEYEKAMDTFFPQLHYLSLSGLPNLMRIFAKANTPVFNSLRRENLKAIDVGSEEILPQKDAFSSIEKLKFCDMNNLNEIRCSQLPEQMQICKVDHKGTMGFRNLNMLRVNDCGSLRNLLCPSIARGLVHLENLIIEDCLMMEEIVANSKEEEEEVRDRIVMPELKYLGLDGLPNLKSFCQGLYAFDFPLLEYVTINDCPKMKTFSFGLLSTPKLEGVKKTLYEGESFWMGDLNNTLQHLFETKELVVNQETTQQELLVVNAKET